MSEYIDDSVAADIVKRGLRGQDFKHPYLGAIVLVDWTFWDKIRHPHTNESVAIRRRDEKVPAIVTKVWHTEKERKVHGVSVLTFPFGEESQTIYCQYGPGPNSAWGWPEHG
jgi:hypothetical protein